MKPFFTTLAEALKDRQEVRLNIKRIAGDLVVLAVIDFKEEGKPVSITGTPADMDENLIDELLKPLSVITKFSSNADEIKKEIEEEESEDDEKEKKSSAKKSDKAKTSAKKPAAKPVKTTKPTKKSAKEIKEEKNREAFDKLIGASRAFISESKFKDAIKNLKAALKLFPKNDDAIKLLSEATEALKAPKTKPSKVEKNPEINFDSVNATMKDQASELSDIEPTDEQKEADRIKCEDLMDEGKIAFNSQNLELAVSKFKEAAELKHISHGARRIAEDEVKYTELAIEDLKLQKQAENTKLATYNAAMIQGKEEMAAKNYEAAVKCYEDAIVIYPHYQEAIDGLAKANQLLDAFKLLNS